MPVENQIRREDIAYRLSKALEIKGQGSPVLTLDPTVAPVVVVEDLSRGNELDYQRTRWCRGRGETDGGGIFGKLSFNNHTGSGILVKVYRIDLFHDPVALTGGLVGITIEQAGIGSSVQINNTKGFTDSRLILGSATQSMRQPIVDIRKDDSGGLSGHMIRAYVPPPPGGFHIDLGGWVMAPGGRLHFESLDVGVKYSACVEWSEADL